MQATINIFWFRRDLRLQDNVALYHALSSGIPVVPLFIFDTLILDKLEDKTDARVQFIYDTVLLLKENFAEQGVAMEVNYGKPLEIFQKLCQQYNIQSVYCNDDYEPYAMERDLAVKGFLSTKNIAYKTYKDHVIFEKNEIVKDSGDPYTIFTPYSRKWKASFTNAHLQPVALENLMSNFYKQATLPFLTLKEMGFVACPIIFPTSEIEIELIRKYGKQRDFPGTEGTSRLGIHLRFGTMSIRQLANLTKEVSPVYLNELIWRDFYQAILWHFPQVGKGFSFKPAYDHIKWRNNEAEFDKWCKGETGYPVVDAGMRQLNETGFMHNRVRMITASFLCKHLLIDWRWGEAYFAGKLLDFDLAANNGGWQWAAGSGCDAAPYFRIFNPYLQSKKFDPQLTYIKRWVPELEQLNYPRPIVQHEFARKRCLEVYTESLRSIRHT